MRVGYVRVSTDEQNTIRQDVLMAELGTDKVFTDRCSGKDTARKELQAMLEFVRAGDTVVVESYSRLARSTHDLLDIVEILRDKGVEFVSIKENIDTGSPAGRLMLTMFAGLYQFERECLLERQAEGISEAKKAGKYKGRKPIEIDPIKFDDLYREWQSDKITAVEMYKTLGLSASTFYRRVKQYEQNSASA